MPRPRAVLVIGGDDAEIRLPISSGAARALTLHLLCAPVSPVDPSLRYDPALLAWSLLHAVDDTSWESLADWLRSATAREELADHVRLIETDEVTEARIVELARRSVAAGNVVPTTNDHDTMAALVHNWSDWANIVSNNVAGDAVELLRSQMAPPTTVVTDLELGARLDPSLQATLDDVWQADAAWHAALVQASHRVQPQDLQLTFETRLEQEKLLSMKELAYGASHEINNPLANIATRAQTLMADEPDPQRRRTLATINEQAFRAHEMIADMMLFAKPPQLELARVDVEAVLQRMVRELDHNTLSSRVRIVLNVNGALALDADEIQLEVALRAICVNALEAMPDGGVITITARPIPVATTLSDQDPAATIEISIRDDGPGLSSEVRHHIFDPFFSGREAGRGLGFGLSKAWRIITEHGGELHVASPPTGGTEFVVRFRETKTSPPWERPAESTGTV